MNINRKKILYGICGIGNGHMQRQLPIIHHFSKTCQIAIFAYGSSFETCKKLFQDTDNVNVFEVAVPFYVGNKTGIDFEATKKLERNNIDFDSINSKAITEMNAWLGTPDLVVSDYEPISAQVAYENDIKLITIDQQSKYLVGDFPETINDCTYADEVARLKLFFRNVHERIACSFFNVKVKDIIDMQVSIVPAIIKDEIVNLKKQLVEGEKNILVYLTSNQDIQQTPESLVDVLSQFHETVFHVFAPQMFHGSLSDNVHWYAHGSDQFMDVLEKVNGIITTAGHTLLAEAMYLEIPVYAIPLPIYEQQMNAHVIATNNFGIAHEVVDSTTLKIFLDNLEHYSKNITSDTTVLCKGNGLKTVINKLQNMLG